MIKFNNVSFSYKKQEVIKNLSLQIEKGEKVALTGASGSGKTTVLRLIMGLEKAKKGKIKTPENCSFSVVVQEDRLIPHKTALSNVALFGDENTAREILCELGLCENLNTLPSELSGGMKRRVALARALAKQSDVLILDEALTGLDSATKEICFSAIEKHLNDRTLLVVSHLKEEQTRLTNREIKI